MTGITFVGAVMAWLLAVVIAVIVMSAIISKAHEKIRRELQKRVKDLDRCNKQYRKELDDLRASNRSFQAKYEPGPSFEPYVMELGPGESKTVSLVFKVKEEGL